MIININTFIYIYYIFRQDIYFWTKKRSSDIREQLGIFNINDKLTQYKINWREHIQRMDDNRRPKIILNYKTEGRRNINFFG